MAVRAKRNWRLIISVSIFSFVVLLGILMIGFAYMVAASRAIGHYAPVGNPVNHK